MKSVSNSSSLSIKKEVRIRVKDNKKEGRKETVKQVGKAASVVGSGGLTAVLARALAKYIRQLTNVGVPPNKQLMMVGKEDNGDLRTFNLLKPLTSQYPLNEFRINRSTLGAFRAIFFEYNYEGEQLLIFTKSVLKQGDPNPPEFQAAMRESEALFVKFHENPNLYLGEDD